MLWFIKFLSCEIGYEHIVLFLLVLSIFVDVSEESCLHDVLFGDNMNSTECFSTRVKLLIPCRHQSGIVFRPFVLLFYPYEVPMN